MLENVIQGFESAKNHFRGRTIVSEESLAPAFEMIRKTLLEADVEIGVIETFLGNIQNSLLGKQVNLRAGKGSQKKTRDFNRLFYFGLF